MTTLLLSKNTKENVSYYLTSLSEEQKIELFKAKAEGTLQDLTDHWGIHCDGVLKVGVTKEITPGHLSEFVDSFPGYTTEGIDNHRGRPTHYRDYSRTLKKQKDFSWLINSCEDTSASVRSALKQMNGKYTILWATPLNSELDKSMNELLKDKVKCKMFN